MNQGLPLSPSLPLCRLPPYARCLCPWRGEETDLLRRYEGKSTTVDKGGNDSIEVDNIVRLHYDCSAIMRALSPFVEQWRRAREPLSLPPSPSLSLVRGQNGRLRRVAPVADGDALIDVRGADGAGGACGAYMTFQTHISKRRIHT
eukprot:COSAG02_NODE_586_length_19960_cov_13.442118_8_plen_146_part_00